MKKRKTVSRLGLWLLVLLGGLVKAMGVWIEDWARDEMERQPDKEGS